MPFTLRELLFGKPLNMRHKNDVQELCDELDACLRGIIELLEGEVGKGDALEQAMLEWRRLVEDYAPSFQSVAVKRAALLFSLHTLEDVRDHFRETDAELVADLESRVLQLTTPRWVSDMAQNPEDYVMSTCLLTDLWSDLQPGARETPPPIGPDVRVGCGAGARG